MTDKVNPPDSVMSAEQFYEVWRKKIVYHRVGKMEFKPEEAFHFAEAYADYRASHAPKDSVPPISDPQTKYPVVVVCGLIVRDGKVLMERRAPMGVAGLDRMFDLPGGKVENGESPADAIVRELREELGIEVRPLEMIPELKQSAWNYGKGIRHWILVTYRCEIIEGEPKCGPDLRWLTFAELNPTNTLAADLSIIIKWGVPKDSAPPDDELTFKNSDSIPFSDSPCGHGGQYAYTSDGGKHVVCLLCEFLDAPKDSAPPKCEMCETGKTGDGRIVLPVEWMHIRGEYSWRHPFQADQMMSVECLLPGFEDWANSCKDGKRISLRDAFSAGISWQVNRGTPSAAAPGSERVVKALKECYVDLAAILIATTYELAPEVRAQLQRSHDLAKTALAEFEKGE